VVHRCNAQAYIACRSDFFFPDHHMCICVCFLQFFLALLGDSMGQEVWYRVVQMVANAPEVQPYAAQTVLPVCACNAACSLAHLATMSSPWRSIVGLRVRTLGLPAVSCRDALPRELCPGRLVLAWRVRPLYLGQARLQVRAGAAGCAMGEGGEGEEDALRGASHAGQDI